MTDPLRSDRLPIGADVPEHDRDARIEELLIAGLDRYFAGDYEQAINVWTRVLFIDRGHARARAYIERARTALAERQRHGDELLHTGSEAVDRGDASMARALVTSAVEHGAAADEALAIMARIDRLESVAPGRRVSASPHERFTPARRPLAPAGQRSSRWQWIAIGVLAGVLIGAVALAALLPGGLPFGDPVEPVPFSTVNAALPVPSIGELALSRAEALHADGRFHEALAALSAVPMGDPHRPRAEALTERIQRHLLAAARSAPRSPDGVAARRP
jgi:hypothetical protein